jgi:septum formation protein
MPKLILASSSPRRLALLNMCGLAPNEVISPDIDESVIGNEKPKDYVIRVATQKAKAVLATLKDDCDDIVISCDTIVVMGARILGKPQDEDQARTMLGKLSGRRHKVLSCVCVATKGKLRLKFVSTQVQFKRLTPSEIEFHTQAKQWHGKAGGYLLQGISICYIKKVNGSVSNVVGLPMLETLNLLKSFGISQRINDTMQALAC